MRRGEIDEPAGGLPKNFLRPCLLLLVAEQPSHGYDLLEQLGELGFRRADPGGLYRALRAMEQEGLMRSSWEMSDVGPARRTYRLTEEGEDWLHAWAGALRQSKSTLAAYLHRYDALTSSAANSRSRTSGR
jgi:PadR family transcriptional regulator PadR